MIIGNFFEKHNKQLTWYLTQTMPYIVTISTRQFKLFQQKRVILQNNIIDEKNVYFHETEFNQIKWYLSELLGTNAQHQLRNKLWDWSKHCILKYPGRPWSRDNSDDSRAIF